MKYHPDAYEMQENPQLCSVIKARNLNRGAVVERAMVYCQMLDENGSLTDWKKLSNGHYEQIKDDSPPKELQSDFTKTVMRIHASGKAVHREN